MHYAAEFNGHPITQCDVLRILIEAGSCETLIQDYRVLRQFSGDESSLAYLMNQSYPPLHQASLEDRLDVLNGNLLSGAPTRSVAMLVGSAKLETFVGVRDYDIDCLLHPCLKRLMDSVKAYESPEPWIALIQDVVQAGEDVSAQYGSNVSPLWNGCRYR